uniref:Uncharacterized protein n=1 Tax=Anguilla anguilla TaxID=7936 RepID=A0A0E9W1T5_ANGAN
MLYNHVLVVDCLHTKKNLKIPFFRDVPKKKKPSR